MRQSSSWGALFYKAVRRTLLINAYFFALTLVALVCLATPAQAEICDNAAESYGEFEIEQFAGSVRDGFPAVYKNILNDVQVRVSDEPGYQTYFENTPQGGEIVVPKYMPRFVCMLMVISYVDFNSSAVPISPEQTARMNALQNPCPPEGASDRCLQPVFELLYDALQPQVAAIPPAFAATLSIFTREALKSSLAHEYGHAIIENGYPDDRRQSLTDHEAEADLLALLPQAGQRAMPIAFEAMLTSMLVVERINKQSRVPTGVHELTACRVLRLQNIKRSVMPQINSLAQWRPGGVLPAISAPTAEAALPPEEVEGCEAEPPAEVIAFQRDLEVIRATIAAMPEGAPTADTLAPMSELQLETTFGDVSRNLALYRAAFAITMPDVSTITSEALREAALLRAAERSRAFSLINQFELSSASARDLYANLAYLEFIQLPPGTRVTEAAPVLVESLIRSGEGVSPTLASMSNLAAAQVLAGACADAALSAYDARNIHRITTEQLGPLTSPGGLAIEPFPVYLIPLANHGEAVDRGEIDLDPAVCDAVRQPAAAVLKDRLGWID